MWPGLTLRLAASSSRSWITVVAGRHAIAASREERLGLLAELVRHGEWIIEQHYEEERRRRAARGQGFRNADRIVEVFGGWGRAIRATMRLYFIGTAARVPRHTKHAGPRASYSREEAITAIKLAHQALGDWPTQ